MPVGDQSAYSFPAELSTVILVLVGIVVLEPAGATMGLAWRLGFPGWRIAAHLGLPIKVKVDVCHDKEAGVYFAVSDDIGLSVEAESLDGLVKEIHAALPELLVLLHSPVQKSRADIHLHEDVAIA